jgi:hypothetical protein
MSCQLFGKNLLEVGTGGVQRRTPEYLLRYGALRPSLGLREVGRLALSGLALARSVTSLLQTPARGEVLQMSQVQSRLRVSSITYSSYSSSSSSTSSLAIEEELETP